MEEKNRKSGIDIIGDVLWGTHFCQFYKTKKDLLDILVPYFTAGLENNEFCMWITSEPLLKKEAEKALKKALPHFDLYLERGQIKIIPYDEWYLKDGVFNSQRVLNGWIDKLNQALDNGYDGMRLTGNTFWLEKRDWESFAEYEEEINSVIGNYRMIAICSYSLYRCSASDVIDVVSNHGFALIKKEGAWKIIKSSENIKLKKTLYATTEQYRSFVQNFHGIAFYRHSDFTPIFLHGAVEEITGYTEEMFTSGNVRWDKIIHPEDMTRLSESFEKMRSIPKHSDLYEYRIIRKDGQVRWIQEYCQNLCDDAGKPIIVRGAIYDITKRKQAEENIKKAQEYTRNLIDSSMDMIISVDKNRRIVEFNQAARKKFGYNIDDIFGKHVDILYADPAEGLKVNKTIGSTGHFYGEILNKCKNGELFPSFLSASILLDENNEYLGFMGISRDITEQKKAEEQIKSSLREKEILLKEIHHRVKNNMQIISSLLSHQADRIKDKKYRDIYYESINRVKIMSLIHDLLYRSEDLSHINFRDYINEICENLSRLWQKESEKIEIISDIRSIILTMDNAISCGLIINELVSNSFKHGFPDNRKGIITITMKKVKNKKIELKVYDNGVGIPETFDWKNTDSLGLHLVNLLAEVQLEGTIELTITQGTEFRITF